MSMLKNLKRWFVVDDEEFQKQMQQGGTTKDTVASKSANPSIQKPSSPAVKPSTSSSPTSPTQGKAAPKFTNVLLEAMEKNNLDGFDYLEYKQSLHNLAKMPMDEQTRYQSAFAAGSTMGATPEKLIKTAHFYIDVLKKEEGKFAEALANQKSKQIGDKSQLIQQHENLVKEKTQQIERLKKEIADHQAKRDEMKKSISQAAIKVETTKNNFVASYNLVLSQIMRDVENMKKYLK